MNPLRQEKVGQNILLKLATLVVILAGIKMSAEIVVPFILAMFLPSSLIRWSACWYSGESSVEWQSVWWW